jgi:putative oxidoreductase
MAAFLKSDDGGKLLVRLATGGLILFHGISKLQHGVGWISGMLAQHGYPGFFAYGTYVAEILCALLVIVGWKTRLAGLVIAFEMVIAVLMVLRNQIFTIKQAGGGWAIELEAFFLLTGLALFFMGAGRYSVSKGHGVWD